MESQIHWKIRSQFLFFRLTSTLSGKSGKPNEMGLKLKKQSREYYLPFTIYHCLGNMRHNFEKGSDIWLKYEREIYSIFR